MYMLTSSVITHMKWPPASSQKWPPASSPSSLPEADVGAFRLGSDQVELLWRLLHLVHLRDRDHDLYWNMYHDQNNGWWVFCNLVLSQFHQSVDLPLETFHALSKKMIQYWTSFVFWPQKGGGSDIFKHCTEKAPKLPLFGQSIPSLTLPTSPYLPSISTGAKTWKCRCAGHTGSPGHRF